MIHEMCLFINFLTDWIALGYRKRSKMFHCNYCPCSVYRAPRMVKHIEDDHPEHFSTSTHEFISHVHICYMQLEYVMTNCKFLPIS
jgi:hypothetical protein